MSNQMKSYHLGRRLLVELWLVCGFGGACTPQPATGVPGTAPCVVAYDDHVWCNAVSYGSGVWQNGQIVRNLNGGLHPVIIVVHGGAWDSGSFDTGVVPALLPGSAFNSEPVPSPISSWLMDRVAVGDAVLAINYRMATVGDSATEVPGAVLDVKLAVRWVKENGSLYGLDPTRITLFGVSAGGQLAVTAASTIGLDGWEPSELPEQTSSVENVVSLAGVYDFSVELLDPRANRPLDMAGAAAYLGCSLPGGVSPPDPCGDLASSPASPATHVSSPGFHIPSLFLVTAGRSDPGDQVVSSAQYTAYSAALTAAGRPFADCDIPGGTHFDLAWCLPQVGAWLDALP